MSCVHRTQSVQYFAHSFITCQVLTPLRVTSTRKMNAFSNETCMNIKHQCFIFNTLAKFIWTLIDTRRSDHMRDATAAISASVVKTTHRPGLFSSTTFSPPQANLHQICIAGLVKHLSPYTGRDLRVNGIWAKFFCPQKMNRPNRMLFLIGCFQR